MFAGKEKMVSYRHFGLVRLASSGYKNVISDVRGSEPGELTIVLALHTDTKREERRLRPEQKSYFPL